MAGAFSGRGCFCPQKPSALHSEGIQLRVVPFVGHKVHQLKNKHIRNVQAAQEASMGEPFDPAAGRPTEQDFKPFERVKERDPYKLLGIRKEATFEEVQDARNYLFQQYKWHEPSRESIELAFDGIIQEKLKARHKFGFRPPRMGRRGGPDGAPRKSLVRQFQNLFDPTVTFRTLIREGLFYFLFALWAAGGADVSFPLACTFAYSVYKFQDKRVKNNPEGPFLMNNPIVGALLVTLTNLAVGTLGAAAVTLPLKTVLDVKLQQVSACITVLVMGVLGVMLK